MRSSILLAVAFLCGTAVCASGQSTNQTAERTATSDELFADARSLAFSGKREEARKLCQIILERSPNYYDARLLMGRTYAWDGRYDLARNEIKLVVDAKPDYEDARDALIDVERWSGNLHDALQLCDTGLQKKPESQTLLYKKALVLESLHELKDATSIVNRLLTVNPAHPEGLTLRDRLRQSRQEYKVTLEYLYDAFDKTFDPWHQVSLSLSRQLPIGPVIGRVNVARHFGESAGQYEVDFYPRIRTGTYAYLNAGYSPNSIFPEFRFGGEIYQTLGRGFEGSFGLRHLRFSGEGVTIYTGSVGKYYRNYWFSFRPYVTPSSIGASESFQGSVRRYFNDADNYVTVTVGSGSFPDELNTTFFTYRLKSAKVEVDGRFALGNGLFGGASFGWESEEIALNNRRQRYSVGFKFEKAF